MVCCFVVGCLLFAMVCCFSVCIGFLFFVFFGFFCFFGFFFVFLVVFVFFVLVLVCLVDRMIVVLVNCFCSCVACSCFRFASLWWRAPAGSEGGGEGRGNISRGATIGVPENCSWLASA